MNHQQNPYHEIITHKKTSYDLKVIYSSDGKTPAHQNLEILLKNYAGKHFKSYKSIFTNQSVPQEILSTFAGLDIVFQCFRQESGFEVNLTNGKVKIIGVFQIKGRRIQKKAEITLQNYQTSEIEEMLEQIKELQKEVFTLKSLKSERDQILNREYHKKFEEERKKFEQVIRVKELQQQKAKQKQKQFEFQIQNLKKQMNSLIIKLDSFTANSFAQLKQLKQKSESCEQWFSRAKQQYENLEVIRTGMRGRKMVKTNQNVNNSHTNEECDKQTYNISKGRSKQTTHSNLKSQSVFLFVDKNSPYITKFKIKDNIITYIGQNGNDTQLLMKPIIPRTQQYCFEFKIIKTQSSQIMIGVVDRQEALKSRFSDKRSISYWGKTGYIWGGDKIQGQGFNEGDSIEVIVQLKTPYIQWKINGISQAKYTPKFFKQQQKIFVPFVQMETNGDCVMWVDRLSQQQNN